MDAHTPFKDARKATYLNAEGADRPLRSPVSPDVLDRARRYRMARIRDELRRADIAAALLFDPVNIRYAFDSQNMAIWTAHNPMRYALVFAEGPGIVFEFKGGEHLNDGLPCVDELRVATGWMFMARGDKAEHFLNLWADEIAELMRAHGAGNTRLAVDRMEGPGYAALAARGVDVLDAGPVCEIARSIKSADEIALMRWTIRVCEAGMARIYENSVPGVTEAELWAHLHFENARSGGEWLETKLLTAGPRTNPWYQECSQRRIAAGEMISFDTDMIGPYGYCADLSRSWVCGYTPMNAQQKRLYRTTLAQIEHNLALLAPGVSFAEFNEKSWRIPERHRPYRYSLALHGVGMADEWPVVPLHVDFDANAMSGLLQPGMVVCVESLVAEPGSESVKLETQVLITEDGHERLDSFPWEDV